MKLNQLKKEVRKELIDNILPFWISKMKDMDRGGYYGRMTGLNELIPEAPKGGILHARILWTFSSAALHLHSDKYLAEANEVYTYLVDHFLMKRMGALTGCSMSMVHLPT